MRNDNHGVASLQLSTQSTIMSSYEDAIEWQPTINIQTINSQSDDQQQDCREYYTPPSYPPTTSQRPAETSLFSTAKRICRGLFHTVYSATTNIWEKATYQVVPLHVIVRQVRKRQREQERRLRRNHRRSPLSVAKSGALANANTFLTQAPSAEPASSTYHQAAPTPQQIYFELSNQPIPTIENIHEATSEDAFLRDDIVETSPQLQARLEEVEPHSARSRPHRQRHRISKRSARRHIRHSLQVQSLIPYLETDSYINTKADKIHNNLGYLARSPRLSISTTPIYSPPPSIYELYHHTESVALETNRDPLDQGVRSTTNTTAAQDDPHYQQDTTLGHDCQHTAGALQSQLATVIGTNIAADDVFGPERCTDTKMPISLTSPFKSHEPFVPIKRPPTPDHRVTKHARRPSTPSSSSSENPITPEKQVFDMKRFLKRDEVAIRQDTKFTPVRPAQLKTPWNNQPSPTEMDFDATITWDPISDKEYRKMCRTCPETRDPKTGEFLPIDGVLSPESFQHNIDMRANKQLIERMKTPGLSLDLSKLSIQDRTPKASHYREQREGRITRANVRKLELEKEREEYKITKLSQEWTEKVKAAARQGAGNYQATDFARVVPQYAMRKGQDNWLNDEVINGYLKVIADHGKKGDRKDQVPSHHAFNSFFYSNLYSKGADSVKNWAKRAKIGGKNLSETEKVFVPINQGMHWTLAVVQAKDKRITVYNSMGTSRGQEVAETILGWVQTELGASFDAGQWVLDGAGVSPQQENSDDCGVFAITNARQVMLGKEPAKSYASKDIPIQRLRIVAELINGALLK